MGKQTVLRLSAVIFSVLLICTIASTIVYDALLPRVTAYTPESGTINGEEYSMVVPASCVYQDANGYYVFRLKELDGDWKVERCSVSVEGSNGAYTAIRRVVSEEIQLAAFPSRTLSDGETVRIHESN